MCVDKLPHLSGFGTSLTRNQTNRLITVAKMKLKVSFQNFYIKATKECSTMAKTISVRDKKLIKVKN